MLIGVFLPLAAISNYSLAAAMTAYFGQILGQAATVLFPAATQLHASGRLGKLQEIYLNGVRFVSTLALMAMIVGLIWASDFYDLWIDTDSLSREFPTPAALFSVFCLSPVLGAGKRVGSQILLCARLVRPLALLVTGNVVLNLGASIVLVQYFGLMGIVLGTVISVLVFQTVLNPWVVCRQLNFSLRYFAMQFMPGCSRL